MVFKCVIHRHLTNPYLTETPSAAAASPLMFLRLTADEIQEVMHVCVNASV